MSEMVTSYEFLSSIIKNNRQIHSLYFREYSFPADPIGTAPALKDKIYAINREDFIKGFKFEELKKVYLKIAILELNQK